MKPPKKTTYLTRVESDFYSRKCYRRNISLFCTLLFTGKWMRGARVVRCLVTEISEGGATVLAEKAQVPDHLYLVFGRFDVVVGSIVVERDRGVLQLSFVRQLKPDFVNRLARMASPFSSLESLNPKTISDGENVKRARRLMPPVQNSN
ncbi:hypothetical protein HB775_02520 [Rhizobium leguminosarum bv. trifolii]|nr:hypothetical protein HB775_02520 [Rhizobium leguminosarum bv. trifolii]